MARSRRRAAARNASRGFTLVELLVTLLLLSAGLITLTAMQVGTIRQVTSARLAAEATRLVQSVIEQHQVASFTTLQAIAPLGSWSPLLRRDGVTQMVAVQGDGESDNGPFTVERRVDHDAGEVVVSVRVSWLDITPNPSASDGYDRVEMVLILRRAL